MLFRKTILIQLIFCIVGVTMAQDISIKTFAGTAYYLGDLAPYSHNLSFSKGRAAFGVSASKAVSDQVKISARFYRGMLEGTDALAKDSNRRRRNLSFESPITEFSLTSDVYISEIIPIMKKWGVDMYVYTGVSVFHFNPRTIIDGQWVDLQPLATEGQGIQEFGGIPKYRRTQVGVPLGFGLQFNISPNLALGFEIAPRLTFTDYLDDVSTDYVDYERQAEVQGELTARLANRIAEYEYGDQYHQMIAAGEKSHFPGYVRGDPSDNDWYLFTNLTLSYFIPSKAQTDEASKAKQY